MENHDCREILVQKKKNIKIYYYFSGLGFSFLNRSPDNINIYISRHNYRQRHPKKTRKKPYTKRHWRKRQKKN
jgi:hypothetical protein